ncbi:MAG: helix-turn-helix transcriptional regulator [Myxococcota bacterium]
MKDPTVSENRDGATALELTASSNGRNHLRRLRVDRMMSKAELARRAGLSPLTIDRIERGFPARMDTMRKILEALGLSPADRGHVFPGAELA